MRGRPVLHSETIRFASFEERARCGTLAAMPLPKGKRPESRRREEACPEAQHCCEGRKTRVPAANRTDPRPFGRGRSGSRERPMPHPDLVAHGSQTRKDIIRLAPGIWSAVGYAASNVHLIEGRDSATIIDTTESTRAAANILAEFRKLTSKRSGASSTRIRTAITFREPRFSSKRPSRSSHAACSSPILSASTKAGSRPAGHSGGAPGRSSASGSRTTSGSVSAAAPATGRWKGLGPDTWRRTR